MKKLKKVMSIVLTTVIVLASCLCVASAEDVITVTYWNADSTKIMIDLSKEVAEADLEAAITLTADGTAVTDFDVVKMPASKETTHGMTANTNYSYVIKPEGGVVIDAVYNLNIAGTDCNKFFSVEELWQDDFQNYAGDTGATTSWRNGTLYVDDNNKYLKVTGMAGKGVYPYYDAYNFSTYGMSATKFFDAARLATTDYSVEVKVKSDESNATNINRTLQISMQTDRTESVGKWGKPGFCGGAQYYKNAAGTSEYNKMFLNAYQKYASNDNRQGIGTMQDNMKDCDGMTVDEQTLGSDWTALSLSVKGNNAKVFAGEDAFANYNHTINLSTGYGAVVFVTRSSGTFYIDDVIATKVIEYEKSEYTISPAGDDVLIGDEVTLTFQKGVDTANLYDDSVDIYKNGVPFYGFSVLPGDSAETVVIKFDMPFEYKTTYSIVPKGIVFSGDSNSYFFEETSFTTEPPGFELTDFSIEEDANMSFLKTGTYHVSATLNNNKIAEGMDVIVSICLFDEDLKMVDVNIKEMSLEMGEDDSITDTWTIDTRGKYIAKCFVWGNLDTTMESIITQTIE